MENKDNKQKKSELDKKLNDFIGEENKECNGEECLIKGSEGLVERVNKKYITDDGRQLLM
jgi:hypothetical protein